MEALGGCVHRRRRRDGNAQSALQRRALGWYAASVVITLPLSPFAIYPILLVAGAVSALTGGVYVNGNAFGSMAVVAPLLALAAVNVGIARVISMLRENRAQSAVSVR